MRWGFTMQIDNFVVQNAQEHVRSFETAPAELMARHKEAMECRDCEAFLQMGIDAFDWILRADRAIRMEIYRGERQFDAAVEKLLHGLCKTWLKPCDFAEKWITV